LLLALRKTDLTPICQKIAFYEEDDLFDVIELLLNHNP
jgi:hypothetical protein